MEPYPSIHPAWLIDKPRTTVAWNKFASSCFCLPGFQQLAHRAGRSMSGLRDDPSSLCEAYHNPSTAAASASAIAIQNPPRCSSYESFHGFVDSVVSDMTESEFSCLEGHNHHNSSSSMIDLAPIRKHSIKGFPPKPPKPWSGSSCNRSFVTTGSSFCSVASSSKRTMDSSSTRHKRALAMHYNDNYQACVEEALNEPKSPWRMQQPQQQQQQQHYLVVEKRSRLDSEISALEMESQTSDGRAGNGIAGNENHDSSDEDDDDEEDSMGNSPFPLLQHKGNEDWSPMSSSLSSHRKTVPHRERKPLQTLPPPPPPPIRRHSLVEIPKKGRTNKKHTFRRRRRQSEPLEMQRRHWINSSEPTDFLCKNAILEECPLLLSKAANSLLKEEKRKVVVSGWIVVLFGDAAVDRCSSLSSSSTASLTIGFGPGDLYYLRIVQDSSVSLVLHRCCDGRQEHAFAIDSSWIVESKESQDRRVGRSISVSFQGSCLRMIPVALQDAFRATLDQRIRAKSDQRIRERQRTSESSAMSTEACFVLPQHGRFAPDAQLDTARHLFFTIDSFAKQQR